MHSNLKAACVTLVSVALALGVMLCPSPGHAEGALAVGLPADVAREGFAAGHSLNDPTVAEARRNALTGCHDSFDASEMAKKLCEVVMTFRNKCFAVAIDPKSGTPGVGWAIAESLSLADKQALEACRKTAGNDRRDFCVILRPDNDHGCDGSAK